MTYIELAFSIYPNLIPTSIFIFDFASLFGAPSSVYIGRGAGLSRAEPDTAVSALRASIPCALATALCAALTHFPVFDFRCQRLVCSQAPEG